MAALQRAADQRREIGSQVRSARRARGVALATVGAAVGRSAAWVSRVERGHAPGVSLDDLAGLGAAVGIRISVSAWPDGPAVRDAGQIDLLRRVQARTGSALTWQLEVPMPIPGDRRAVDAVVRAIDGAACVIEAITRIHDLQAQLRSIRLKARDLGIERIVVVVAATARNRALLRQLSDVVGLSFSLDTRAALTTMAAGRIPERDAIILV